MSNRLDELPIISSDSIPDWYHLEIWSGTGIARVFYLEELNAMANTTVRTDFFCNDGWEVPDVLWSGIRLAELLRNCDILMKDVSSIEFYGGDYSKVITQNDLKSGEAILALTLDGADLPAAHGGPCRLVVKGLSGDFQVKWLNRIRVF
ncbi:MAG: molybdopterin-dependent oxidoreductase [SAR202 cluster bacterium]|nr:molybdopterin-dependent oxidoreductase [SAR202 cluster bacterium]